MPRIRGVLSAVGVLFVLASFPSSGSAQLVVTEVMYDPASEEADWEWIEVRNAGGQAVDLNGFYVDRIGDRPLTTDARPQVRSMVDTDRGMVGNPTLIPADGVAVLYNGRGLDFRTERFRAAWPLTPAAAVLIGVDGWSSNQLNNAPAPSDLAPELPGQTVGFWPTEQAYRFDVLDAGDGEPDLRVSRVANAAFSFSYDDSGDWPANNNAASIALGAGARLDGVTWRQSMTGIAGAYQSTATTLAGVPLNGSDFGSPGAAPVGSASGLAISEIMYDPASVTDSTEWEWIELVNGGPAIDFSATPYYFDDDDGTALTAPNVDMGVLPAGGVAVLYNAAAAAPDDFAAAWGAGVTYLPIADWPTLANGGDTIGLWNNASAYENDVAVDSIAAAVAGVVYQASGDWPSNNDTDSISLADLSLNPSDGANWVRASDEDGDPAAFGADPVFGAGTIDNSGEDIGSPGLADGFDPEPLAGDYNADGRVNAADYTIWRDGRPLANETASPGVIDSADYEAWAAAYQGSGAVAIPEPAAGLLTVVSLAAFSGARRGWLVGG